MVCRALCRSELLDHEVPQGSWRCGHYVVWVIGSHRRWLSRSGSAQRQLNWIVLEKLDGSSSPSEVQTCAVATKGSRWGERDDLREHPLPLEKDTVKCAR